MASTDTLPDKKFTASLQTWSLPADFLMKGLIQTIWHLVALLSVKLFLIGLLFLLSLFVLFHLIHDVFADGDTGFDHMMFALTDRITSPGMTRTMRLISFLGSDHYLIIMPALLVLIFSLYKDMRWNRLRVLIFPLPLLCLASS